MEEVTMHVTLPIQWEQFVHAQVESGRYHSASDVIRVALQRLAAATPAIASPRSAADPAALIAAFRELRATCTLGPGLTLEELLHDGHRL